MSENDKPTGTWRCRACGSTWAGQQLYADPTSRHLSAWTCGNLQCGGVCDHLYQTLPEHRAKPHLYRLTLRPASISCYPTQDADGNPLTHEITETHWPPVRTPDGRNHYATVAYAAPLSFAQVWHYDLQPVDAVEAARYLFWAYYDRDPDKVARALPLWLRLPAEHLRRMVADGNDALRAAAALVIQTAEGAQS